MKKRGFVLMIALIFIAIIVSLVGILMYNNIALKRRVAKSFPALRAGDIVVGMINRGIYELVRTNGSYTGTSGTLAQVVGAPNLSNQILVNLTAQKIKETPEVDYYKIEVTVQDQEFDITKRGEAIVKLYKQTIPFPIASAPTISGNGSFQISPIPWVTPNEQEPVPILAPSYDNIGGEIAFKGRPTLGPGVAVIGREVSLGKATFVSDLNYPPNQVSGTIVTGGSGDFSRVTHTPISLESIREALNPLFSQVLSDDSINLPEGTTQPAPQWVVNQLSQIMPNGNLNIITLQPNTYYEEIELTGRTVIAITQPGDYYIGELKFSSDDNNENNGRGGNSNPQGNYYPIVLIAPDGQDPSEVFGNALVGEGVRFFIGELEDERGLLAAGNVIINPISPLVSELGVGDIKPIADRLPSSPTSLLLVVGKYKNERNAPEATGRSIIAGYLIIDQIDDNNSFKLRGRTTLIGGLLILDPEAILDIRGKPTLLFDPNNATLVISEQYLQYTSIASLVTM